MITRLMQGMGEIRERNRGQDETKTVWGLGTSRSDENYCKATQKKERDDEE